LKATGQLQESSAAQQQANVAAMAQQGRTVYGMQSVFGNLLGGLAPTTTGLPPGLQPTGY